MFQTMIFSLVLSL